MVGENTKKVRNRKAQELTRFFILAGIIILVNLLASQFFFRVDLTEDKRYSIAPATKKLLTNLDDVVYVEVFLEGEFPAGFKRLQSSIKEKLDEFRIYSGNLVGAAAWVGIGLQMFWAVVIAAAGRAWMARVMKRLSMQGG